MSDSAINFLGGSVRAVITTVLEVLGITGCVVMAALSPVPWVAFGVGGIGLILISRGVTRGDS